MPYMAKVKKRKVPYPSAGQCRTSSDTRYFSVYHTSIHATFLSDFVFSTAHKIKGLEFPTVKLCDDFFKSKCYVCYLLFGVNFDLSLHIQKMSKKWMNVRSVMSPICSMLLQPELSDTLC